MGRALQHAVEGEEERLRVKQKTVVARRFMRLALRVKVLPPQWSAATHPGPANHTPHLVAGKVVHGFVLLRHHK